MRKVFQNVKNQLGHNESVSKVSMDSEKMHISIWTLFTASSMKAALHMDPSYATNLEVLTNSDSENIESLFNISNMMIGGNSEIRHVFSMGAASPLWEKSTLLNDQAMRWEKTRVYVYSDSVLCLEKCTIVKMQPKGGKNKCQF